jgi:cystathionine gamma-synthase
MHPPAGRCMHRPGILIIDMGLGELHDASKVVALGRPEDAGSPVNVGLTLTSTYRLGGEINYARDGNAGWTALECALGALEGGDALVFSSGMAAVAAVLETLPAGALVVASQIAYHGVHVLMRDRVAAGRIETRLVDARDVAAVADAVTGAALVWLETPMNPLLDVADIAALSEAAHAAGAAVIVDSTLATPLRQRPLELGADLVLHSATKFIGGHSDLLLGAVVTADPGRRDALLRRRTIDGSIPGALEAFLALRGLRTLAVRLDRAEQNAGELASRLAGHPGVARVRYPGLPDDPAHEVARRQMSGFGAMVAFETIGDAASADAVCDRVELVTPATSLGGVETLIERRARYPGDAEAGVPQTLLRLSVGIEDVEDLWRDLAAAFDSIGG